jgi:hypothetical protein
MPSSNLSVELVKRIALALHARIRRTFFYLSGDFELIPEGLDDPGDGLTFNHHFLVMASALRWISRLHVRAHEHIEFQPCLLEQRLAELLLVLLQELQIKPVLPLFPKSLLHFLRRAQSSPALTPQQPPAILPH